MNRDDESIKRDDEGSLRHWIDDELPKERRFALGTREMEPLVLDGAASAADGSAPFARTSDADLEAMPDAAFSIDESDRIEDLNGAAEELVGSTRAALVGTSLARVLAGVGPELRVARTLGRVRGVRIDRGVRLRRGDDLAPVDVFVFPCGTSTTVTVRPRPPATGDGLRQEEVAQIVHDIKNPLATMLLELFLLDDSLATTGHQALRRTVARITHNVTFLDRIVQDLLDSCALDAGHFQLHRRPTELRTLLESVIERAVPSREHGRVYLEASQAVTLDIDDLRIERVVANLLTNALKYAPETTGVVVRLDVLDDVARVCVIDSGAGIAPADKAYIFERYRRAPTARAHEGSGLGLYVSRRIVEAHGGTIDVEGVHGIGTCFFFDLPRH
jgi:signal transduction histidine kinase